MFPLIDLIAILMMLAKLATLKLTAFRYTFYEIIIFIYGVTNKTLYQIIS